jgi:hypothetical protein
MNLLKELNEELLKKTVDMRLLKELNEELFYEELLILYLKPKEREREGGGRRRGHFHHFAIPLSN